MYNNCTLYKYATSTLQDTRAWPVIKFSCAIALTFLHLLFRTEILLFQTHVANRGLLILVTQSINLRDRGPFILVSVFILVCVYFILASLLIFD